MSFSKYNVNALTDPMSVLPSPIIRRPRQNSVFVGGSVALLNPPPRRVKSAIDIQYLVVNEHSPTTSLKGNRKGSIIPILNKERRPSLITIDRPYYSRHRPSITIDRPHINHPRKRRQSCFAERTHGRHRNFMSFENSVERKPQADKPSCSFHPTISFETPMELMELPTLPIELPPLPVLPSTGAIPKTSRSFEQPNVHREKSKPERSSHSLDVSSITIERRNSIPEEDRGSPVFLNLDETRITAPLLEGLKSSDV